jgi:hypothetical protein
MWSSKESGKTPEEVRRWYVKAIGYHSAMLARWRHVTPFTAFPVETGKPPF